MTQASSAHAGREQDGAAHSGAACDDAAHGGASQEDPQDSRIPVWRALSELYLDTDAAALYPQIAETLADSPYALDALHDMLRYDIHPARYPNWPMPRRLPQTLAILSLSKPHRAAAGAA